MHAGALHLRKGSPPPPGRGTFCSVISSASLSTMLQRLSSTLILWYSSPSAGLRARRQAASHGRGQPRKLTQSAQAQPAEPVSPAAPAASSGKPLAKARCLRASARKPRHPRPSTRRQRTENGLLALEPDGEVLRLDGHDAVAASGTTGNGHRHHHIRQGLGPGIGLKVGSIAAIGLCNKGAIGGNLTTAASLATFPACKLPAVTIGNQRSRFPGPSNPTTYSGLRWSSPRPPGPRPAPQPPLPPARRRARLGSGPFPPARQVPHPTGSQSPDSSAIRTSSAGAAAGAGRSAAGACAGSASGSGCTAGGSTEPTTPSTLALAPGPSRNELFDATSLKAAFKNCSGSLPNSSQALPR